MNRPKVFYLITGLHIGGAERLLLQLVRCLDRSRYEPVVVTLVGGELIPEFEKAGVRVYNLRMRHKLDLRVIFSLRHLLIQERPEILHTHLIYADFLGRVVGRWCGVPVIVTTLHMLEAIRCQWFFKTMDRWASRLNNALIAVSDEVKRSCVRVERLDPSRIHVIPNAIEKMGPFDSIERQSRRQRLHLPKEAWLVGVVSRLDEPRKGHRVLLEAMSRLVPRWPHLHCVLIGDGLGRQSLEAHTQALGLQRNVTFLGTQHDIGAWLSALDLFVLPSLHEGSPIALLEAMAAGCPIIATRVGGIPEMLSDQEAGLLVPAGDADALAHDMERLLTNRDLAAQLGSAAQRRFDQKFEMRQVVRQTEVLYDLLLNRRHPKQVKVLEVATTLDAGGVTTYLVNLVRLLPRRDFEIHLASGMEQFQTKLIGSLEVPHHPVALTKVIHPFKDLKALWQLVRLIRRQRFDIVHVNMAKAELLAGLAARLGGVRCVIGTSHGPTVLTPQPSLQQALFNQLERFSYRHLFHRVIAVSEATRQMLLQKKAVVDPARVVTIHNGISSAAAPKESDREQVRRELGLSPAQPVVTMVSRLAAQKSPEVLIRGIHLLRHRWPDLVCLIIGDGPRTSEIEELIRSCHLESFVRLLGHRNDVPRLLGACDLFVLSTHREGLSISVLEAMAAGLPVVASRVEGMEELVDHGRTGLLFLPGDAAACADALETLLHDSDLRRGMGAAALKRRGELFDLQQQVERTQQLFLDAMAKKPSLLSRLRFYLQEEGLGPMLQRLARVFMNPFFHSTQLWFLSRSVLEPMVQMKPRIPCVIRPASLQDLDRLAKAGFLDRSTLAQWLGLPQDRCFIAEWEGRVVAYQWLAMGEREFHIDPLERSVHLKSDEAYLYNCRALHKFRSKGIVPAIEAQVVVWLKAHGFRTLYTDIQQRNRPSLSTFHKLGFRKLEAVTLWRLMGHTRILCEQPRRESAQPIRILVLESASAPHLSPADLARNLDPKSFQVTLARWVPSLRSAWKLLRQMRRQRFEIVHCMSDRDLSAAGRLARLAGIPHVTVESQGALSEVRWNQGRRVLEETSPLDRSVTLACFNGAVSAQEARQRFGLKTTDLIVGTLLPKEAQVNWESWFSLCRYLHDNFPQSQFLLASEKPVPVTLKQRTEEMGLSSCVQFLQRDFNRRIALKAADLWLDVAQTQEGRLFRLEAMASSRPVIPFEPSDQAAHSAAVLLQKPEHLHQIGLSVLAQVKEGFQEKHLALQMASFWEKAVASDRVEVPAIHWRKRRGCTLP